MSHYRSNSRSAFFGGPIAKSVTVLIAVNVGVWVLQMLNRADGGYIVAHFGLVPYLVTHRFMIWQLASYMFLHDGFFHLFINMLTLYMFGSNLERTLGVKPFLIYYFVTGIGAGLCSCAVAPNALFVIVGASSAIFGLLLAYGLLYPNQLIQLQSLSPIRVKWLLLPVGALVFLSSFNLSALGLANLAQLSGMLVGYVYVKAAAWVQRVQPYQVEGKQEDVKRLFDIHYPELRPKTEDDKHPVESKVRQPNWIMILIGLLAGGFVSYLLRPSAFLVGQLPFETVIIRGANLRGLDQILEETAKESFNILVAGCIVGAFIGFLAGYLIPSKKRT
jgi:membrane associated rhomboid family serine protease